MAEVQSILEKRVQFNVSLCKKSNGTKINLERAAQNIVDLQRGLTGSRALAGNAYMQKAASLQSYLLYYWPVSYAQTAAALGMTTNFFERVQKIKGRTIRILDLGSGPAPASCSIADLAQGKGERNMSFEFSLLDSSGDALSLGKRILEGAFAKSARVETYVCNFEKVFGQKKSAQAAPAFLANKKFDFIVASHSLNELWKNEKKRGQKIVGMLQSLSACLEDGGLLILMEPALLATSRALMEVRDALAGLGLGLVSPCPKSFFPCPALENPNATCHYQFDWEMPKIVADLAALAKLNRADVKMTFFVFERGAALGQEYGFGNDDNSLQDKEAAASPVPDFSNIYALVVSEPMLNKAGRIRYLLCDGKSRFSLSAKNGDPIAAAQNFFSLRRYDKVQVMNPQVRSQKDEPLSLGFEERTRLEIQRL